jgi:hypothetical protein
VRSEGRDLVFELLIRPVREGHVVSLGNSHVGTVANAPDDEPKSINVTI